MLLSPDLADAFGDWLDLDRIRRALLTGRPDLEGALSLDEARPLLSIRRPDGHVLLVARSAEDSGGRWIIGVPGAPQPVLHDAHSREQVVATVLEALPPRR